MCPLLPVCHGCSPFDALATAVDLFYAVIDFTAAQTLMFIGLTMAAIVNLVILLLFSLNIFLTWPLHLPQ